MSMQETLPVRKLTGREIARERRARLARLGWANGRTSSELEVMTETAFRAKRHAESLAKAGADHLARIEAQVAAISAFDPVFDAEPDPIVVIEDTPTPPTVNAIVRAVCEFYGVSGVEICSERRTYREVRPRQVAMYLARVLTTRSLPQIAERLGRKDHTTILHGYRKIMGLLPNDRELADEVACIKRQLRTAESLKQMVGA